MSNPASKISAHTASGDGNGSPLSAGTWYRLSVAEAFEQQTSGDEQGLTSDEAARRLARYGPNILVQARRLGCDRRLFIGTDRWHRIGQVDSTNGDSTSSYINRTEMKS